MKKDQTEGLFIFHRLSFCIKLKNDKEFFIYSTQPQPYPQLSQERRWH